MSIKMNRKRKSTEALTRIAWIVGTYNVDWLVRKAHELEEHFQVIWGIVLI